MDADAGSSSSDERAEPTTMQALPARRPAVLRTYGKPKPAPTTSSTTTPLHAEQSFTSDLTSLSQLSQAQRDDDEFNDDDEADKDMQEDNEAAQDSGIALYESTLGIGPHKSAKDLLREIDEAFDDDNDNTDAVQALLAEKAHQSPVAPVLEAASSVPMLVHERVSSAASTTLSDSSSLLADREHGHAHSELADTTSTSTKGATSALNTTAHNTDEDVDALRSDALHSSPPTSPRSHAQALINATTTADKDKQTQDELVVVPAKPAFAADTRHEQPGAERQTSDSEAEKQSSAEAAPRRRMLATGRKSGRVLDSDDEDEMMSTRAPADSDEELPTLKDAAVARKSKSKSAKGKLFASDSEEDDGDAEETPETQKTEDIESYNDNTSQSQIYQSKTSFSELVDEDDDEDDEDGQGVTYKQRKKAERKKAAAAADKEKKVKPLNKKEMEEMHRVAEQAKRSRQASIMPRSRPARPLSEISQRIHNKDLSGRPSIASSARPLLTHRPRSGSAKPALSLRAASVPFSSLFPPNSTILANHTSKSSSRAGTPVTATTAAATASRAPIEIGSSSAIFDYNPDEDSYDPSYLRNQESQSQSQAESQTQARSIKADVTHRPTASARPLMSAAPESSDEELLDLHQIVAKERKKKDLQNKKAAALAQVEAQQYQREQRLLREQQLLLEDSDPKGKGREIVMDLDSDPDDLEVVAPRAPSPVIAGGAHKRSPRSRQLMRQLAPQSVKKEREVDHQDLPESQFQRAGRTWGKGENKVVIAPHVALKESRPRNSYSVAPPGQNHSEGGGNNQGRKSKKTDQTVTKQATDRHLLEKASRQAALDKLKRMEDWKKRGGTLRHDGPVQEMSLEDDDDEEAQQQQQGDRAKDLMDAIREEAEKAPDAGDEDDEDDGDYVGSDEEEGMFSGEDEEGSADEQNEQEGEEQASPARNMEQGGATMHHSDTSMEDPDMSADLSSIAPTEVVNSAASDPQEASEDEEDENVIIARRKKQTATRPVFDDDDEEMIPASSAAPESIPRAATQYHDFFMKGNAEAFPEAGSLKNISLTQAFGQAGATQAPQASRAVFDDEGGFSQMFGGDDEGFTQTQAVLQTGKAKEGAPLPSMFRARNSDSSPELQRHVLGEAPMLLDAALRDAQIREEAERAFDELQARKVKSPVTRQEERDLTRTPASTVSEEMPPLPFVTMPGGHYSESAASENELDQTETQDLDEDGTTPLQPRRLLRRANTEDLQAVESDQEDSPEKPRNAFDALKEGQHRATSGAETRAKQIQKRKNRSEFVAEEVEESEDEGGYSMLRKAGEEDEDEDDSDLDKEVEGLVDDQKGDAEEEAEQDRLARAKHEELLAADDAKMQKHVQKVVDGKMKKRRRGDGHGGELSDSDYEDDAYYRAAKAKKAKQYSGKMEALADNAETQAFARAGMDDGTEDLTGDWMMDQDATSDAPSEPEELSDMEGAGPVRKRSERHHYVEEYTESYYEENEDAMELATIDRQIWGVPSSPVYETQVQDTLVSIAAKHMTKTRIAEDFDDLETHYSVETQLFKRREVKMDKEESQNERGVGPGRSSAVTSFVRKNDKKAGAGGVKQSRPTVPSAIHSKLASRKSVQTLPAAGAPGRLAAARQGKR